MADKENNMSETPSVITASDDLMYFEPLPLAGAFRIVCRANHDERGYFVRHFCAATFRKHDLETNFVQRSTSFNKRSRTIRGLHFQIEPFAETKVIRCTKGRAFDVLVDLRSNSSTFGRWHGETIGCGRNEFTMLYIPRGFAHGFQTLADDTEIYYEITPQFTPAASRGIRYDDPTLNVAWPHPPEIISDRDSHLPFLDSMSL